MIADFDDFCLWMYVVVDELWRQLPARYKPTSGPVPACSDSELITMAVVGECRGWGQETVLAQEWRARRHLFPQVMAACRNTVLGLLRRLGATNIAAACRRYAAQPAAALLAVGVPRDFE